MSKAKKFKWADHELKLLSTIMGVSNMAIGCIRPVPDRLVVASGMHGRPWVDEAYANLKSEDLGRHAQHIRHAAASFIADSVPDPEKCVDDEIKSFVKDLRKMTPEKVGSIWKDFHPLVTAIVRLHGGGVV